MKRIALLLLTLATALPSAAQTIAETINQSTKEIETLQCDFVQNSHLKMLSEVVASQGKMYYSGGDRLRWEYLSPYTYTFILNGGQALLKKNGREDMIDVNQNRMFKEIARIMMNTVLGKCIGDDKSFSTSIKESEGTYEATLVPVKKDMQQMFPSITLCYDRKQKMITRVVLNQKNGDWTEILLKNISKNCPISDDVFSVQ